MQAEDPTGPTRLARRERPVREVERHVTRADLAQIMGISIKTVDRMVAEGLPSETWGRRSRRFRPSVAIAWARTRSAA